MSASTEEPRGDIRDLLLDAANLSLDQLPMLPVIFDRVGSNLAERLRQLAWSPPHVSLAGLASARVGESLDPYEMNAIAAIFSVPAWDSRVIIGFDRDFVHTMMELLFGGDGSEPPTEEARPFSHVEIQICQALFEHVGQALQASFALVSGVRFLFERIEIRMDFAAAGRRHMPAAVAKFILQALNRGGEMFVVIPQSALSPLRQALSRTVPSETALPDPRWARQISEEVQRTAVTVRAVIEADGFTLADIAGLRIGQVLMLPAGPDSRVKVHSNDHPLFWAYLGQDKGLYTLCIDEPIDHEREFVRDVLAG
jgi:flagellar motor switch protein FliM